MSSYSGASDRVSPGPKKRSLLKRLGSRAEHSSSSLEDRTLAGERCLSVFVIRHAIRVAKDSEQLPRSVAVSSPSKER